MAKTMRSFQIGSGSDLLSQGSCPSTISAGGLNFRVRDGNGCGPSAVAARMRCGLLRFARWEKEKFSFLSSQVLTSQAYPQNWTVIEDEFALQIHYRAADKSTLVDLLIALYFHRYTTHLRKFCAYAKSTI